MPLMKVLITVKTYPIPSAKYDELVCTAGVNEQGEFVRIYPVNFRDLPFSQQYQKYQWIEVDVDKHKGRDTRKESFRPTTGTIEVLGKPLPSTKNWSERSKFVMPLKSQSMEELIEKQKADNTSLGLFKPKKIHDLVITDDDPNWTPGFLAELNQARLWEHRKESKEPPRKVPFKFRYHFECDDPRCKKNHRMMIEDWEVGALYWNLVDKGLGPKKAAEEVKRKFLNEVCRKDKDTHFYVGTVLAHGTWVIIGVYWPPRADSSKTLSLFEP
jgi:hypothetical protein